MPYIKLSVTQKLTQEKEKSLVDGLGIAMRRIPGKDEKLLIVDVEDGRTLYFGGEKQEDMAFADVRWFSRFEYHKKKEFTEAMFDAINQILGTSKDKMCLTITEFNNWGARGSFRDEYYEDPE
jgi:phenylpyruvate tautomerase PptA (4-oxalocrotonate tautomerase family)